MKVDRDVLQAVTPAVSGEVGREPWGSSQTSGYSGQHRHRPDVIQAIQARTTSLAWIQRLSMISHLLMKKNQNLYEVTGKNNLVKSIFHPHCKWLSGSGNWFLKHGAILSNNLFAATCIHLCTKRNTAGKQLSSQIRIHIFGFRLLLFNYDKAHISGPFPIWTSLIGDIYIYRYNASSL